MEVSLESSDFRDAVDDLHFVSSRFGLVVQHTPKPAGRQLRMLALAPHLMVDVNTEKATTYCVNVDVTVLKTIRKRSSIGYRLAARSSCNISDEATKSSMSI